MNLRPHPEAPLPVPHPTIPDQWTQPWMDDERTITRDGNQFIAHIGCQFRCWSFEGARKQCIEDMEHQSFLRNRQIALHREQDRQIARLTPEQFERVIADKEQELAGLSVNSVGRADMLREDIRIMQEARARS